MNSAIDIYNSMDVEDLIKEYRCCNPQNKIKLAILQKIIKEKSIENKKIQEMLDKTIDEVILSVEKNKSDHNDEINNLDPMYKEYLKNDIKNNKLMDRLNIELDFRTHNSSKNKIVKPYADIDCGDYVSVKKFNEHSIPKNNFSSQRLAE